MFKIFVDGLEGTTGLQILDYLTKRRDIELLKIDSDKRKDLNARAELINASDLTFLCLPDDAARQSVSLCTNPKTCIIDASTAHRVHPAWVYGLPELCAEQREKIKNARRIANPGCHASAFILAVRPLIEKNILKNTAQIMAHSLTGYSGGGKKMIAEYEEKPQKEHLKSPRPYALNLAHKHLPEMQFYSGLKNAPTFLPIVADYFKGLSVCVFLNSADFNSNFSAEDIQNALKEYYKNSPFIRVLPLDFQNNFWDIQQNNGSNFVDLQLLNNGEHFILMSRLDNLGKGASGAAIQSMNIYFGLPENTGL